ncbi:MAG: hypothetical protein ACK4L7_10165, partial [Flavobacteriales bacterium]
MPIAPAPWQSIRIARCAALAALALCQQPPVGAQGIGERLVAFDREAQAEAMGYRWLSWSVARIGHRLTGSAQGAKAEAAADSLFRVAGLPVVERFPFTAQAWSRGMVKLTIGDGEGFRHLSAVALANTPLDASVEAPLLDAGNGLPADLDAVGPRIRGAALLVNIGLVGAPEGERNLHRSEKAK